MAVYFYICPVCQQADRRLLKPVEAREPQRCRKTADCPGVLVREVQPPNMVHKEVIDNGIMTKRVERDIDAERLAHERATKDYSRRD